MLYESHNFRHAIKILRRGVACAAASIFLLLPVAKGQTQTCSGQWLQQDALGNVNSGTVYAVAAMPGGDMIAGGTAMFGGSGARGIARWNGASWSQLGTGLTGNSGANPAVFALQVLPNGDLIVGGDFTLVGAGFTAKNIARWSGTSWSPLGSGLDIVVRALTFLPDGKIVAGGGPGSPASRVSRWDGTSWTPMLFGQFTGEVRALAVLPNGDLISGGQFTIGGNVYSNNIARWDGGTWQPVGSSFINEPGNSVNAFAILPSGELVAGGLFLELGMVARWNGTTWASLGGGMEDYVYAFALLPDGDLVATGRFLAADFQFVNRIARWDGAHWSSMGSGLGDAGYALAMNSPNRLVVGGDFLVAGGLPSRHLATWEPPGPSIISQPASVITCRSNTAEFTITTAGTMPMTYSWRKHGTAISPISNPSAATSTLSLTSVGNADQDSYDCVVGNACGIITSAGATLTVCIGDYNCDGGVDGSDVGAFFSDWEAGSSGADVDADGGVDGEDVEFFFDRWEGGC